jgi:chorismate synthase
MASNSFGQIFKITTWGESHGPAVGVVIDGCPAGVPLQIEDIQWMLNRRAPGAHDLTSPRMELDEAHLYSGVFEGYTTGAPISIVVYNRDADSSKYTPIKNLLRPGHAQYTYQEKYGIYDYRGGGRASARETLARVAAGAVAKKVLSTTTIEVKAFLYQVGDLQMTQTNWQYHQKSPLFCTDEQFESKLCEYLSQIKNSGNSIGGVVGFVIDGVPVGLGDPIYEKLEANLAHAMLTIPASKAFEIGDGFASAKANGKEFNDLFAMKDEQLSFHSNHAGGILAGISNGMPIEGRIAFKPTSSINLSQQTVNMMGQPDVFQLPKGSRHDPCVAIRAVPVVEAMCYLVLVDAWLTNQLTRIG